MINIKIFKLDILLLPISNYYTLKTKIELKEANNKVPFVQFLFSYNFINKRIHG
jgi:hypothetical protein